MVLAIAVTAEVDMFECHRERDRAKRPTGTPAQHPQSGRYNKFRMLKVEPHFDVIIVTNSEKPKKMHLVIG